MRRQAQSFGAEFLSAEVRDFDTVPGVKKVSTSRGDFSALGIIVATGANPRRVGFKGESEFQGRGVAYCATCDGEFFTGKEVLVVGGGFAAVEESIFLTKYASRITILVRKNAFSCAQSVVDELKHHPKISVRFNTELQEVDGDSMVSRALLKNNVTGKTEEYRSSDGSNFGVFVFAGYSPNTSWLPKEISRNEGGYVITDANCKTSVDGVYAAGDLRIKELRQVVTAVSDGATAATSLEKAVQELHNRLEIGDLTVYAPAREAGTPQEQTQSRESENADDASDGRLLTAEMRQQLAGVFGKMTSPVTVKLWEDGSRLSALMRSFMQELDGISDKIRLEYAPLAESPRNLAASAMELLRADGSSSGALFHAVPGGHELNSFVVGVYNTGGPGQPAEQQTVDKIAAVGRDINVKILVSLSCTMCPETVMSAHRAAIINPHITAEMFDLAHFPDLQEKHNVRSVPAVVLNDGKVLFGKKSLGQMAEDLASFEAGA